MEFSYYQLWKLVHIGGILMWVGPPLGAYWMQIRGLVRPDSSDPRDIYTERKFREAFIGVLWIEHIGFALLLIGAWGMVHETNYGILNASWVRAKLLIVVVFFIPLEVLDVWWGQIAPARAMRKHTEGINDELRRVLDRYDRYVRFAIPGLIVGWILIFIFAIFRPVFPMLEAM